ncbi:MAG TPA: hypothetical protein VFT59_02280 [Candidatus Saccharimonadales bacterium]|nr:hypothetical protein [Candidatus Saccharimonadales bacterium]
MNDYGTFRRHWIALPLEVIMLGGVVVTFSQHNWKHVLASLFTFTISFAPLVFEKLFRVRLPMTYQFVYVLFVFASMFLGEVAHLYRLVRGWDAIMHFLSGVFVGLGVVLWLRTLLHYAKKFRLPLWMQGLFVICFGVTIAVTWEIIEFGSDQVFGTTSQDRSLYDTMTDLIYGTMGVLLLTFLYSFIVRDRVIFGLTWAIEAFERLNRR